MALEATARHLGTVRGRKNLIWVSAGFPLKVGFKGYDALSMHDRETLNSQECREGSQSCLSIFHIGKVLVPLWQLST